MADRSRPDGTIRRGADVDRHHEHPVPVLLQPGGDALRPVLRRAHVHRLFPIGAGPALLDRRLPGGRLRRHLALPVRQRGGSPVGGFLGASPGDATHDLPFPGGNRGRDGPFGSAGRGDVATPRSFRTSPGHRARHGTAGRGDPGDVTEPGELRRHPPLAAPASSAHRVAGRGIGHGGGGQNRSGLRDLGKGSREAGVVRSRGAGHPRNRTSGRDRP